MNKLEIFMIGFVNLDKLELNLRSGVNNLSKTGLLQHLEVVSEYHFYTLIVQCRLDI